MKRFNPALGADGGAYSGIPTYMRQPASREIEDGDVVIIGIPFDSGTISYRSGSRFGPRRIREASLTIWGYNNALEVDPTEILSIVDYGDVRVVPMNIDETMQSITDEVGAILKADTIVIALGGDHSITLPLLRAYCKKYGQLSVVHFDAHTDTEEGRHNHGTSFRCAIEEGLVDTSAYFQVGIRGSTVESGELQTARDLGAEIFTIDQCMDLGTEGVTQKIRKIIGKRRAYVSFDIDSVDPAFAPGTGVPVVGGFSSHQILRMIRGLVGLNFVGLDVVEVSPPYDPSEITSILAATLVFEFLSLLALKRSAKNTILNKT